MPNRLGTSKRILKCYFVFGDCPKVQHESGQKRPLSSNSQPDRPDLPPAPRPWLPAEHLLAAVEVRDANDEVGGQKRRNNISQNWFWNLSLPVFCFAPVDSSCHLSVVHVCSKKFLSPESEWPFQVVFIFCHKRGTCAAFEPLFANRGFRYHHAQQTSSQMHHKFTAFFASQNKRNEPSGQEFFSLTDAKIFPCLFATSRSWNRNYLQAWKELSFWQKLWPAVK